jgi:hypothetical protein
MREIILRFLIHTCILKFLYFHIINNTNESKYISINSYKDPG